MDGDVIRVKSTSPKMIRVNGKFKSTASLFDGNGGNNRGSFSFNVNKDGSSNDGAFEWPDKAPEPDTPEPDDDKWDPRPMLPPEKPDTDKPPWDIRVPDTQLQRDIASVRDVTIGNPNAKIADWTGDPEPPLTQEEYEGWAGTTLKLAGEILFLVGIELASKPLGSAGEYLSGIASHYIKVPKTIGMIAKWFGNSKYKSILNKAFNNVNRAIKGTPAESVVKGIDYAIQTVGFNYGMEIFKTLLTKLFPDKAEKISLAIKMLGYGEFVTDPIGTTMAFIDVVVSFLFESDLPDRGNFEKVFIFKPFQDSNA